ncbi:MAG: Gfo/Idh/MocA family oxidoreductase [Victivallaceae bacterium]|nr:Gfo/Idh/MocA family oxidoreductase [Victivallaceae bacterium]
MDTVSILLVGAGGRCSIYSQLIKRLGLRARVVGVAEPRPFFRDRIVRDHDISPEHVFSDWRDAAAVPRFADAVIIGTQDRMHVEPAEAFARLGYHILIEKPLAPDAAGCRRIVSAAVKSGKMFSVCHVMRYANYTALLRSVLAEGAVGKIISIQHLEPVGHWRFAHSYVRGNWRREDESSSFLLAKSIHDVDWISYIVGRRSRKISSFGELTFFRRENMPEGAALRCLDCPLACKCAYNAPRFYLERLRSGKVDSYLESVSGVLTEEAILDAMRNGPYGRCVFACDNDVADHQVTIMEFDGGVTASFTLVGCSRFGERRTTIFGTEGEVYCDGSKIRIYSYLRDSSHEIEIEPDRGTLETKHGGGDKMCLESFIEAIRENRPSRILSDAAGSLETHLMVFAAEASRRQGRTVYMNEPEFAVGDPAGE